MQRRVRVTGVGMTPFETPKNADPCTVMATAAAQSMTTDADNTFGDSRINTVGFDMSRRAVHEVYAKAGIGPRTSMSSSCTIASPPTS